MTAPERDDRRSLAVACLLLLLGAGTAWLSGNVTWFSVQVPSATGGTAAATVTGSQIQPTVTAVAAVLVAAVAAAVALSGIARRVLGVLVVLAGVAAAWTTVTRLAAPPTPAEIVSARVGLNTAGQPIGTSPVSTGAGAWVAVAAAVLAVAAGTVLVVRERRMARLGARYAAPGAAAAPSDPDRAAWEQLDDGGDPTADPTAGRMAGPAADPSRESRGRDL